MPPFEHLHPGAPYPPPLSAPTPVRPTTSAPPPSSFRPVPLDAGFPPLPPSRGSLNPPKEWAPSTFYDTGVLVQFEGVLYRSTGLHLSGESQTPATALATWIPLEKSSGSPPPERTSHASEKLPEKLSSFADDPVPLLRREAKDDAQQASLPAAEPPPEYPAVPLREKRTYADAEVQTELSFPPEMMFPPWVFNSWPMPGGGPSGSFGSHPLSYPWLPPPIPSPYFTAATNSTQTLLPLPPQQQQPQQHLMQQLQPPSLFHQHTRSVPDPPTIHAPMPLHLPLRLPPNLESVLAPISDPLDTRYRAARAAERAQQSLVTFRGEAAGERVVRSHGCGVWAFGGSRERALEQEREAAWRECGTRGPEAWLRAARARRAAYAVPGAVRPPVRWVLVEEGQKIPEDALQTGVEATGEPLFSTRVWWKGGLHLGKAANHIYNYASISWDSQEHTTPTFEVLCGSPSHVQWLEIPHGTRASAELFRDFTAVEGGREATGTFIFVAQGEYGLGGAVGLHPGKASRGDDHACIGYGGGEVWIRPFRLLVYAGASMG